MLKSLSFVLIGLGQTVPSDMHTTARTSQIHTGILGGPGPGVRRRGSLSTPSKPCPLHNEISASDKERRSRLSFLSTLPLLLRRRTALILFIPLVVFLLVLWRIFGGDRVLVLSEPG